MKLKPGALIFALLLLLGACSSAPPASQSPTDQPENLTISAKQITTRPGTAVVTVYPHSSVPGSVDITSVGGDKLNSFHDYNEGQNWKNSLNLWYGGEGILGSPYFKIVVFSPTPGAVVSFKISFHGKEQTFSVKTP